MTEPDFVHVLPRGGTVDDAPVGPHPLEAQEIDCLVDEMESARAEAAASCGNYMTTAGRAGKR